jgi:YbbR domain-containing protein
MVTQFLRGLVSNLPLKIAALLVALSLWLIAALDRTYSTTVVVPVTLASSDSRSVLSDIDTRTATVTLTGKGKDLLNVRRSRLGFRLNVPETRVGRRQLRLLAADLALPKDVALAAVDPEFVELRTGEATARVVQVSVPLRGVPPSGVTVTVNRPPASVKLHGPEDELALLATVNTESLDLGTVSQPGTRRLRVVPPPGLYLAEPESVDIQVSLEREGARIFLGIPVTSIAPGGRQIEIDPDEAQVAVAGPVGRIDSLKAADIAARIKISGLGPGDYRLAAEIVLPPGFRLVKCEPQLFDVTVK